MKVTVCELSREADDFPRHWEALIAHVKHEASDLVLLPEMPFYHWLAATSDVDPAQWQAAVQAHDAWQKLLPELAPAAVLASRPVIDGGSRFNRAFVWEPERGYHPGHDKYYLPDEEGFWEASWYQRGNGNFTAVQSGHTRIGFAVCTEIWFTEHARAYAKQGVHILANPRATEKATIDKWLAGGRTAAVCAGAFCLSSNHVNPRGESVNMGGQGWVISPDGDVLGLTSQEKPFITVEIDLREAERAKRTYPRYVY